MMTCNIAALAASYELAYPNSYGTLKNYLFELFGLINDKVKNLKQTEITSVPVE
jgi:hypothetical protein